MALTSPPSVDDQSSTICLSWECVAAKTNVNRIKPKNASQQPTNVPAIARRSSNLTHYLKKRLPEKVRGGGWDTL